MVTVLCIENIYSIPGLYALDASSRPPHPPTCPQKPQSGHVEEKCSDKCPRGTNSLTLRTMLYGTLLLLCCHSCSKSWSRLSAALTLHSDSFIVFHRKEPEFLGGCWNLYESGKQDRLTKFWNCQKERILFKVLDQHLKKRIITVKAGKSKQIYNNNY